MPSESTPERRVGEEWVKEIAALPLMDGSVGLPRLGLPKSSAAFPHFCRVHNGQVALAGDLLDAAKEVARLTAEVERLRGLAKDAIDRIPEGCCGCGCCCSEDHKADRAWCTVAYAALSLPTPAPEATE